MFKCFTQVPDLIVHFFFFLVKSKISVCDIQLIDQALKPSSSRSSSSSSSSTSSSSSSSSSIRSLFKLGYESSVILIAF